MPDNFPPSHCPVPHLTKTATGGGALFFLVPLHLPVRLTGRKVNLRTKKKIRKFVTRDGFHPSIHIEGVVPLTLPLLPFFPGGRGSFSLGCGPTGRTSGCYPGSWWFESTRPSSFKKSGAAPSGVGRRRVKRGGGTTGKKASHASGRCCWVKEKPQQHASTLYRLFPETLSFVLCAPLFELDRKHSVRWFDPEVGPGSMQ